MDRTEDGLRSVVAEYDEGKRKLLETRDARLREYHERGWRPVDLQRVTGYSRETIRQALHPNVRAVTNAGRRKPVPPVQTQQRTRYGDQKPYAVADSLYELRGPTEGTVTLPHHMDWSGRGTYELDKPARLASMYKTVLNEASSTKDLQEWLDRRVLVELWPNLWLPPRLRELWERKFPELAARRKAVA
jgi:hypothetical protein